jgi:hypothetical protein
MLGQSMSFYQDEFAGRIATKVMQTALAVRDVDDRGRHLVFVVIYFVTMSAVVGGFDAGCCCPSSAGSRSTSAPVLLRAAPGRVAQRQADARSLMTGRITDAYTNIATVKLFSHAQREAGSRGGDAGVHAHGYGQMRLVSGFEIVNHALSMALIAARRRDAVAVDRRAGRRRRGGRGHRDGAAPERHLALGHVGDGRAVRAHRHGAGRHQHAAAPHTVVDGRTPAAARDRGEIRFEHVSFATAASATR